MANFWKNWLTFWCICVGLFGLLIVGGVSDATDGPLRALLHIWGGSIPYDPDAHNRFAYGLLGAVTIGWSFTLYASFKAAMMLGDAGTPIWRIIVTGALLWYAIDSTISVATGFWMNAVSNTVILALLFVPLLASGVLRRAV